MANKNSLISPELIRLEAMHIACADYNLIPDLQYSDKIICDFIRATDKIRLAVNFYDNKQENYAAISFEHKDLEMSLDDLAERKIHPFILSQARADKKFIHMDYT